MLDNVNDVRRPTSSQVVVPVLAPCVMVIKDWRCRRCTSLRSDHNSPHGETKGWS